MYNSDSSGFSVSSDCSVSGDYSVSGDASVSSDYSVYSDCSVSSDYSAWEGKESLVITACACAKISIFYPRAIRGLADHMIIYYASQARASKRRSFEEPKNKHMLEFPF